MRRILFLLIGMAAGTYSFAQPSLAKLNESLKSQRQENSYILKLTSPTQGALQINEAAKMPAVDFQKWISSSLRFRAGRDALEKLPISTKLSNELEIDKYQQYYQGIKVEHGLINVVSKGGKVAAVQLEFYPLEENFPTTPKLTEAEAFGKATAHIGAAKYVWEGYTGSHPEFKKPSGALVIVEDYYKKAGRLKLAYKFEIYAEQPLSRSYVYVNAWDGSILLVDRIIKHLSPDMEKRKSQKTETFRASAGRKVEIGAKPFANAGGSAQTRYSGTQNITTDNGGTTVGKPYRLSQTRNGHSIATLNYERRTRSVTNDGLAIDFIDNDNNWTTTEHALNYDDAAFDVQHAMQYVSDYWKNVHNRSSWDNANGQMKSYVHVRNSASAGYDNAFWSGSSMYYGDGSYYSATGDGTVSNVNGFKPLTSIDVSAHELGHAITQATSALIYQRESGGLNEGFSDIWAACVENYSGLPKNPFLMGEDLIAGGALRSMQNPKLYGDPDTYGGTNWQAVTLGSCPVPGSNNDNCGVHYNSGVLNKWFYLITQGGSGTNDKADSYQVTGLGFAKTEKITYLLELSLTPSSDYAAARAAAINAATALYGACSNEVVQVTNAWFAVGVGETANCSPVVEFSKKISSVAEGEGLTGNCSSRKTVMVPFKLGSVATQKVDVQFSLTGTAVQGVNYTVASPIVSFHPGENGVKNLELTVLDNATLEGNKTIIVNYTINANGGNGTAGVNNQTHTITITDDDVLPLPIKTTPVSTVTLLSENFEAATPGEAFPTGWASTLAFAGGNSTINKWVIGANAGTGITGNAAYVSKTATGALDYGYDLTSTTDRVLRLPALNTTGYTDIRMSFKYKAGGEAYPVMPSNTQPNYWASLWDYGRVVLNINGNGVTFASLFNASQNEPFTFYDDGTTARTFQPYRLPSAMENKSIVYVGFRWLNDNADGDGIPMAIDDILITARTAGTSIGTGAGQSNSVRLLSGTGDTYIAGSGGTNLLAKISNLNQPISCLTASIPQAGNGRTALSTNGGSFFRTQKIIQLTPGVANSTATYQATFYFTAADLTGWSASEIPLLKILKVKDGVNLNGTLAAGDAELVTPTFTDNSASGYYSYAGSFTGFSQFMLVSPGFTLPVNLLVFDVQPRKKAVELVWKTASEQNNKGFEVERSENGVDYTSIGWQKGAGTASTTTDYRFTDNYVQPNTTYYYRLKQVDLDNQVKYSLIRQAKIIEGGVTVTLSPNPVKNRLKIFVSGTTAPVNISLVNSKGQQVAWWKKVDSVSAYDVDVSRFSKGQYTVVVHLPEGDKSTQVVLQ